METDKEVHRGKDGKRYRGTQRKRERELLTNKLERETFPSPTVFLFVV